MITTKDLCLASTMHCLLWNKSLTTQRYINFEIKWNFSNSLILSLQEEVEDCMDQINDLVNTSSLQSPKKSDSLKDESTPTKILDVASKT